MSTHLYPPWSLFPVLCSTVSRVWPGTQQAVSKHLVIRWKSRGNKDETHGWWGEQKLRTGVRLWKVLWDLYVMILTALEIPSEIEMTVHSSQFRKFWRNEISILSGEFTANYIALRYTASFSIRKDFSFHSWSVGSLVIYNTDHGNLPPDRMQTPQHVTAERGSQGSGPWSQSTVIAYWITII